ncbi:MAG TPA: carbohydrate porin [Anaeromyxobacter sp.]|nr:carbohydrate porin [Anaeromyxobacter sp.]
MKAMMKAAAVVVGLLAFATPALAVDFFGYFRDGDSISSKGGPAPTFGTPGMDYKLRLGNEGDNYGEWGIQNVIYKDKAGVEVTAGVMFNYDQGLGVATGTAVPFGIQQNYFKMKVPQWAGATFWGGKQYYERENIDMIDHFYLNTSDTGIGVENVDTGFGKLSFSIFGANGKDSLSQPVVYLRPDLRLQGIPVWANGTILVDLNYQTISRHSGTGYTTPQDEGGGVWVTLEWHQDAILGGWNNIALQYANGSNSAMGGGAPSRANKNDNQFAVWEQLLLQPIPMFDVLVGGTYQAKTFGIVGGGTNKVNSFGLFARPKVWLADYFAIQGDIGYTAVDNKPNGGTETKPNLVKWTIAPTLLPAQGDGGGFFVRPEFRLFITGGSWNDDATKAGIAGGNFGTDTSGMLYGFQVEGWF